MKNNNEPIYDDYLICPKCKGHNKISKEQYIGGSLCECLTKCENCNHETTWAYGFYTKSL